MPDIVEVVRCKNCDYFVDKTRQGGAQLGECEMHNGMYMFYDDFCSYGNKKGERKWFTETVTDAEQSTQSESKQTM